MNVLVFFLLWCCFILVVLAAVTFGLAHLFHWLLVSFLLHEVPWFPVYVVAGLVALMIVRPKLSYQRGSDD